MVGRGLFAARASGTRRSSPRCALAGVESGPTSRGYSAAFDSSAACASEALRGELLARTGIRAALARSAIVSAGGGAASRRGSAAVVGGSSSGLAGGVESGFASRG